MRFEVKSKKYVKCPVRRNLRDSRASSESFIFAGYKLIDFTVVTFSNLPPDQKHNHQNNKKHTMYKYYHRIVLKIKI